MAVRIPVRTVADDQLLAEYTGGVKDGAKHQAIVVCDAAGNERTVWPVSDNAASLTVDAPATAPLFTREAPPARTLVILSANAIAGVTAEAMMAFQSNINGAVTANLTSYTVAAGKRLRIQKIEFWSRMAPSATAAAVLHTLRLRLGNAVTSPLVFARDLTATNDNVSFGVWAPIDGIELAAGTVVGVSHVAGAATALGGFVIVAYEYSP